MKPETTSVMHLTQAKLERTSDELTAELASLDEENYGSLKNNDISKVH